MAMEVYHHNVYNYRPTVAAPARPVDLGRESLTQPFGAAAHKARESFKEALALIPRAGSRTCALYHSTLTVGGSVGKGQVSVDEIPLLH